MDKYKLKTDEGLEDFMTLYNLFCNRFSESLTELIDFNYFLEFAKKYDFYSTSYNSDFKYKKFPLYEIDYNEIELMYDFLKHHAQKISLFECLESHHFFLFIAPFLFEYTPQLPELGNSDDEINDTIILNYNAIIPEKFDPYELH